MFLTRLLRAALFSLVLLWLTSLALVAQDGRGKIVGRITDPSGALVSGVDVKVRNTSTDVVVSTRSNEAGSYAIPYLLPGFYTIQAELAGFKKYIRERVEVRVSEAVDVQIAMELGNATESVEVKAETPLLNTAESSLGEVVDSRRVAELPTFGGNPMALAQLAPGVTNATDMRTRKTANPQGGTQFSTDGTGLWNNEVTLDGMSNMQAQGVQYYAASVPPTSAISEFRVQTTAIDASVGHTVGSVLNMNIKSGANQLHAEAHEWFRNRDLDAPNIFQNRTNTKLPVYQDNRFGASGGGPVFIPKLYNGKNRTFWFHAYEANIFGVPQTFVTAVPNASARAGDLSYLLKLGANYQIYDPFSATLGSDGKITRTPFANNIIDPSRINPIARKIMALWPSPNQAGNADGTNNWVNADTSRQRSWTNFSRVDHNFSEKNRLFVRFNKDHWQSQANRTYSNSYDGVLVQRNNTGALVDDVLVLSPSLLFNVRYGITRQWYGESRLSQGFDLTSLGFSQSLVGLLRDPTAATVPWVTLSPYGALGNINEGDGIHNILTHSLAGNVTKSHGGHAIRTGVDFRFYTENHDRHPNDASPVLTYDGSYASASSASAAPTLGGQIATFLLGIPQGSLSHTASYASSEKYLGLYVQDDWRVSSRLTVNMGVRYELESPIMERYNRAVTTFAFNQANPLQAAAIANYAKAPIPELSVDQFKVLGGLEFAGVNGDSRHLWTGDHGNFMPRIGFAYTLNPKTVLRAGYATFYNTIGVAQQPTIQTGFSQTTPIQASTNGGLTFPTTLSNPFPNGLIAPLGAGGGLSTALGQSVSFYAPDRKHPYLQRWSINLQRELPGGFVLRTAYVGSRGTHLGVNRDLNADPRQYLSTSLTRDAATITKLTGLVTNPFYGLNSIYSTNMSRISLLRPYPEFGSVTEIDLPIGYTWYHSLQTDFEKRFSHGYTIQGAYTWSKSMEAIALRSPTDPRPLESIGTLDRPHRIVVSWIWDLPFGRGRSYGQHLPSALNFVAGGWTLNGVYQHQSGPPLEWGDVWTIFQGDSTLIGLPKDQRSPDHWFNVTGFNRNSAQQLANNIRYSPFRFGNLRADGQSRWDFTAMKDFHVTEALKVQFKAECDNALNHPNLFAPTMTPTSSLFGTVTSQDVPRVFQLNLNVSF